MLTTKLLCAIIVVAVCVDYSCCYSSEIAAFSASGNSTVCPVWSKSDRDCSCGSSVHHVVISCSDDSLSLQNCFCMYYDKGLNTTTIGSCFHTCLRPGALKFHRDKNATKFNQEVCLNISVAGNMHRRGRFCGECEEGYGLAAYSYHFIHCINCTDYGYKNWFKYFTIACLPLTVFYFVVISFRIRVTFPPMNCVVLVCQLLTLPTVMRIVMAAEDNHTLDPRYIVALNVVISIFGVWSLDFFRPLYTPFCLHPSFKALQIIALDYLIAVYPLLLIFLTYILLELHDRNYRIIVCMWSPFKWFFGRIRNEWNLRASLVDGFNSFLIMSYMKLLSVSFSLTLPTKIYDVNATLYKDRRYLYYDANVELFSKEHLPYAILASVVLLVLVLLPLVLLCLYPCCCFQRLLNRCGLNCQALRIFMDSFQGCYKIAPYDCRYFAGFYLLLRIVVIVLVSWTLSVLFITGFAVACTLGAVFIVIIRPYKQSYSNTIDAVLLLSVAIVNIALQGNTIGCFVDRDNLKPSQGIVVFSLVFSVLCCLALLAFCVCKPGAFPRRLLQRFYFSLPKKKFLLKTAGLVDPLPDRLANSDQYDPLLSREASASVQYGALRS